MEQVILTSTALLTTAALTTFVGFSTRRRASAVAGEILLGSYTPFCAANYAIGITAVLPTNGAARAISGITARDMMRTTTFGELDAAVLAALTPTIGALACYEGLPCPGLPQCGHGGPGNLGVGRPA